MKKCMQWLPALALLLAALSLTSCNKEELVAPVSSENKNARLSADNLQMPKITLLTRQDQTKIERNPAGIITNVTHSPHYYITYTTEPGEQPGYSKMTSTSYSAGKRNWQTRYSLKDGKAISSHTTYFDLQSGAVIKIVQHWYIYNGQGQLLERLNLNHEQDRITFSYNAEGNLSKVTEYNSQGIPQKTSEFIYSASAPADKYGFYPDITGIDPFLKVLGTFFKKLPTGIAIDYANPADSDAWLNYTYQLDAGGYPVSRTTYKKAGMLVYLLSTRTYGYEKFNIGLQ